MSIAVMNRVWLSSQCKGGPLLVLLAIADCADDEGVAYPGEKYLAKKARMTDRNVRYSVAYLIAKGELSVEVGAGPQGTNLYTVRGGKVFQGAEKHDSEGWKNPTVRGGSPLPTIRQKREPSEVETNICIEAFNKLWELYPKREGSNPKSKALSAFRSSINRGNAIVAIRDGLERYIKFVRAKEWEHTGYVMQAARFFGPNDEWRNEWHVARATYSQPELPDWSLPNA